MTAEAISREEKVEMAKAIYDSVFHNIGERYDKELSTRVKGFESGMSAMVGAVLQKELAVHAKDFEDRFQDQKRYYEERLKTMQAMYEKSLEEMKSIIKNLPATQLVLPEGAITVRIDHPINFPEDAIKVTLDPTINVSVPPNSLKFGSPQFVLQKGAIEAKVDMPNLQVKSIVEVPKRTTTTKKSIAYSEVTGRPESITETVEEK